MRSRWPSLLMVVVLAGCARADGGPARARGERVETLGERRQAVVSGHPRLWITAKDLPRLRSWAVASNPFWQQGLLPVAARAVQEMDDGTVPGGDSGQAEAVEHPTEMHAMLFAFMSLVHPDASKRDDYASRARTLLMHIIDAAAQGASPGAAFRDPGFSIRGRSRWHGESFGLVVDWIYPKLSAADKGKIHQVFSRWIDENMNAGSTSHNHPEPVGLTNDPRLIADKRIVRWSANNYYLAHMRNLGLMGLALDPADDPDGKLRKGFESAVGAFLYVNDHLRRTDSRGGLSPEGPYYAPESVSYTTQLLLALATSGADDTATLGKQVAFASDPYWDDILSGWFHQYPPTPRVIHDWEGPVWENAWSGDGATQSIRDPIALFGPLGIYHYNRGNEARLTRVRWLQEHFPRGGKAKLQERAGRGQPMLDTLLYFLLYEPGYVAPADPRPSYPSMHVAAGIGHLFARTGWDGQASFFRFICGYNTIDHQHGDGNHFGFWRKGEWLTRDRTGYGQTNPHSQFHNTVSIENDPPSSSEGFIGLMAASGSQWMTGMSVGDGEVLRHSSNARFVYALGDATALYNSADISATGVVHASRSIVWLKPDHVVYYDRAETSQAARFKRLWQQLPSDATISGKTATATSPKGQKLFITTLLPKDAALEVQVGGGAPVDESIMTHRLRVDPGAERAKERFLHVFQGADASAKGDTPTLIEASEGGYAGAAVAGVAVLFPEEVGATVKSIRYRAPGNTQQHIVTGLKPGQEYKVDVGAASGGQVEVGISEAGSGESAKADSAGVLAYPEVASEEAPDGGLPPLDDGGPSTPGQEGQSGHGRNKDGCSVAGPGSGGSFAVLALIALLAFWRRGRMVAGPE